MDKRILIVDDDKQVCDLLSKILRRHKFDAECAESFKEGLICAKSSQYDLVVLDLSLKDSTPHQSVEHVVDFGDTPVIVATGVEDPELIRKLVMLKIDYIIKGGSETGMFEQILKKLEQLDPSLDMERLMLKNRKRAQVMKYGKVVFAMVGFSGLCSFATWAYATFDHRITAREGSRVWTQTVDASLKQHTADLTRLSGRQDGSDTAFQTAGVERALLKQSIEEVKQNQKDMREDFNHRLDVIYDAIIHK